MRSSHVRNRVIAAVALCCLLLAACTSKRPSDVLSPEALESFLYDYHLAQSMISDLPASERYQKDLYFDYIYDKHSVTAAEVDSSLVYYARYPKELSTIYLNLSDRVERVMQRIEQEGIITTLRVPKAVVGDSADLWYERPLVQMSPSRLANHLVTTVPYDTNFKSNDSFEWSGRVLFVYPEPDSLYRYLHLTLVAEYDNDSILSVDTTLYTTGSYHLALADTAGFKLRSLSSDAYYKGADGSDDLLIYDTHLMRYHYVAPVDSIVPDSIKVSAEALEEVAVDTLQATSKKSSRRAKKSKQKQS